MGIVKEIERSGLTPKSFVIGTIATLFFAWEYAQRGICWTNNGLYGGISLNNQTGTTFTNGMGASMMLLLIFALVNSIRPVLSKQEIALIVLMPLFSIWWQGYNVALFYDIMPFGIGLGYIEPDKLKEIIDYIPDVFGPKDPTFWNSGWMENPYSAVPWMGLLAGQMGWLILWQVTTAFLAMFLVLLARRLYVHIEYLTSPIVEMYTTMIESVVPAEGKKRGIGLLRNKLLLAAFIIGFLHVFLHWGIGWLPPLWTGDIGSRFPNRGYIPIGGVNFDLLWIRRDDLTRMALIPWVSLYISLIPMEVAWMTLQTLDVLYGFLAGWFIMWILWPLIEVSLGRYPAMTPGTGNSAIYQRVFWGDPGGLVSLFIPYGIAIGLAIYPIWRNRKLMGPILMSLFKKPPEDVDKESPLPYRLVWIGLIICIIVSIAALAMTGAAWGPVAVYIIVNLFVILGTARMMAETGGYMGCMIYLPWQALTSGFLGAMLCSAFGIMGTATPSNVATLLALNWELCNGDALVMALVSGAIVIAFFQIGDRLKIEKKSTGKTILYAIPLAIISTLVFAYWWLGFAPTPVTWTADMGSTVVDNVRSLIRGVEQYEYGESVTASHVAAAGPNMVLLLLGIAIAFIVPMLRVRMPWLRLSVAGIMFGMLFGFAWWFVAILAILIKLIVIKVGGIRLHDQKLKPLCVGLSAGSYLGVAIFYLISGLIVTTWSIFETGVWDLW